MVPEETDSKAPAAAEVPDSVLRAALLRRAVESLSRLIQVRMAKQAITGLLARGSVGDDLHQRLQRAEKEIDLELRDVVNEANAYAPGWGAVIFSSANEMYNNATVRKRLDDILAQTDAEKEWWEKRRESIRTDFMKELGEEEKAEP
jgi:translocation protein SEC66